MITVSFINDSKSLLNVIEVLTHRSLEATMVAQFEELYGSLSFIDLYGDSLDFIDYNGTDDFLIQMLKFETDFLVESNSEALLIGDIMDGEWVTDLASTDVIVTRKSVETGQEVEMTIPFFEAINLICTYSHKIQEIGKDILGTNITKSIHYHDIENSQWFIKHNAFQNLLEVIRDVEMTAINEQTDDFSQNNLLSLITLVIVCSYVFGILISFPPMYSRIIKEKLVIMKCFERVPIHIGEAQKMVSLHMQAVLPEIISQKAYTTDFFEDTTYSFRRVGTKTERMELKNRKKHTKVNTRELSTRSLYTSFLWHYTSVVTISIVIIAYLLRSYWLNISYLNGSEKLSGQFFYSIFLERYNKVNVAEMTFILANNGSLEIKSNDPFVQAELDIDATTEITELWSSYFLDDLDSEMYALYEEFISENICKQDEIITSEKLFLVCTEWVNGASTKGYLPLIKEIKTSLLEMLQILQKIKGASSLEMFRAVSPSYLEIVYANSLIVEPALNIFHDFVYDKFFTIAEEQKKIMVIQLAVFVVVFVVCLMTLWVHFSNSLKRETINLKRIVGMIPPSLIIMDKVINGRLKKIAMISLAENNS